MFCFLLITLLTLTNSAAADIILNGNLTQGGIIFGETKPGHEITLDNKSIRVSREGYFLLGFSRDANPNSELIIRDPEGRIQKKNLKI
ncbi:MAG: M23 family peptidase, partial [Pseudomonadota bacterium]|nr:M23 family peptidase [Pseudomonadota bacterium]